MTLKITHNISSIDLSILILILGITLIDTFNGILVMNDYFSISKPYKFVILIMMTLNLMLSHRINKYFILVFLCFSSFFIGYFYYFLGNGNFLLFVQNLIESTKYFIWPISFIYFRAFFLKSYDRGLKLVWHIINFSYLILLINIFIGLIGLGYQFYPAYDTGIKGFFFSGNEFSLLFVLLTWIKSWQLRIIGPKKYYAFIIFSLFLAFNIGSKTTILGVLAIFLVIQLSNITVNLRKISPRRILIGFIGILILPLVIWIFVISNKSYFNDFILKRLEIYNYDLLTWFLSKRNLVAIDSLKKFDSLNIMSKYFGQGESSFQNNMHMVELDFIDLMLNHGYIGLFLYSIIILIFIKLLLKNYHLFPINKCVFYFYIIIILILSNLSGHIINTGVPGFFMGMLFSITFSSKEALIKTRLL